MNIIEWRNYLCNDEKISSRAKHIGLTLSLFYRQDKRTYPSIDTICIWSSLAPNTVSGALKDLQKAGFIDIKSYRLPNARFRGHEYVFCGLLSDCNIEEKDASPSNFAPTVEPAIEAAIEPSNFAYKEEEEEEKKEREDTASEKIQIWNDKVQVKLSTGKISITETRRKRLKKFKTNEEWEIFCQKIINSDFLIGKNNQNWKVNIDWVLKPENTIKIQEGNYDTKNNYPIRDERETLYLEDC